MWHVANSGKSSVKCVVVVWKSLPLEIFEGYQAQRRKPEGKSDDWRELLWAIFQTTTWDFPLFVRLLD